MNVWLTDCFPLPIMVKSGLVTGMDLAHYADSDGYWDDHVRPHAWRWRHWLVDALNRNMRSIIHN